MKTPRDVGKDFDEYARKWRKVGYRTETGFDGVGISRREEEDDLENPGDEWGDIAPLIGLYRLLFDRYLAQAGPINVLEIGAGGGRATQAVVEVLSDRVGEYHVLDVSEVFVEVLRSRLQHPIEIHIVDDVDLSGLPENHFDLCLAQSSWSHISMYDQYRYLRDLRRVMRLDAPVVVNGQFPLGLGHDWTWNRFRRRVYQAEHGVDGVYHEMTGVAALAEQLIRLEYDIDVIHNSGFLARTKQANPDANLDSLAGPIAFPYVSSLVGFAKGETPRLVTIL